MPHVNGISHIALTVSDLEASSSFYELVFGFGPAASIDDQQLSRRLFTMPSGTNVGLTEHDPSTTETFTPFRPGLDHLGFDVDSEQELRLWADHLTAAGIEHSGLVEASYGTALSFKDPDGTALEFFVGK